MPWTWQLKDWPNFRWRNGLLEQEERRFAEGVSVTIGSLRHLPASERDNLAIALLERDALGTSAIEGEQLRRCRRRRAAAQGNMAWPSSWPTCTRHQALRSRLNGCSPGTAC
mgnify:CR=1 FL=1